METGSFIGKCDPWYLNSPWGCVRILEDAFLLAPLMVGMALPVRRQKDVSRKKMPGMSNSSWAFRLHSERCEGRKRVAGLGRPGTT
jgi:hypothetical protein